MDKFYGINRAEITAVNHLYGISEKTVDTDRAINWGETAAATKANAQKIYEKNAATKIINSPKSDTNAIAKKDRSGKRIYTALRYGFCAAVLLVCFLGKITSFSPLKEASGFIKDELNRDIIRQLSENGASDAE